MKLAALVPVNPSAPVHQLLRSRGLFSGLRLARDPGAGRAAVTDGEFAADVIEGCGHGPAGADRVAAITIATN